MGRPPGRADGGTLQIVATWEWPTSYGWAMPFPSDYDPTADVAKLVEGARAGVEQAHPGIRVSVDVIEGHAAPVLVEATKGADLLVLGSRGHGAFAGMLLGSVSEHCVSNAHCPVLVIRGPESPDPALSGRPGTFGPGQQSRDGGAASRRWNATPPPQC